MQSEDSNWFGHINHADEFVSGQTRMDGSIGKQYKTGP